MAPNMIFPYGEELLVTLPNPKLEYHPISVGRDCLFDVLTATVHIQILLIRYLIVFPVAYSDATNSVSFLRSFHREYFPS
jgi:hypothetical protein